MGPSLDLIGRDKMPRERSTRMTTERDRNTVNTNEHDEDFRRETVRGYRGPLVVMDEAHVTNSLTERYERVKK